MKRSRKLVCVAYGVIAVAALALTWSQNIPFFKAHPSTGMVEFWAQMKVNLIARSITVDLAFFLLAAALFMITEARRLNIRFVWLYILFGYLIDISVAFPIFMIVRERAMARAGEDGAGFTTTDLIAAAATAGVMFWLVWFVLR